MRAQIELNAKDRDYLRRLMAGERLVGQAERNALVLRGLARIEFGRLYPTPFGRAVAYSLF